MHQASSSDDEEGAAPEAAAAAASQLPAMAAHPSIEGIRNVPFPGSHNRPRYEDVVEERPVRRCGRGCV